MTAYSGLTFSPLLPWWLIGALGLALAIVVGLGFWRRARGTMLRLATLGLGLLALANPILVEEQREAAYRFGVNLVMYALTGNYKADQVHVPAILERLGQ